MFSMNCDYLSGGAGGKGVWGKPGEEVSEDGHCKDSHDPNYDSASEVHDPWLP